MKRSYYASESYLESKCMNIFWKLKNHPIWCFELMDKKNFLVSKTASDDCFVFIQLRILCMFSPVFKFCCPCVFHFVSITNVFHSVTMQTQWLLNYILSYDVKFNVKWFYNFHWILWFIWCRLLSLFSIQPLYIPHILFKLNVFFPRAVIVYL